MNEFAEYIQHGWKICRIEPGTKGPTTTGWNEEKNALVSVDGIVGAGLMHAYSGTCALDIDNWEEAEKWLKTYQIDLKSFREAGNMVSIMSGRENRGKFLFRLDTPLPSKTLAGGAFELRSGTMGGKTVQDVLPPTIHPETGQPYRWIGDWRNLPLIPESLLTLWKTQLETPTSVQNADSSSTLGSASAATESIQSILRNLDPSCGYDEWIKIGMAIHHETGGSLDGFTLWDDWSSKSEKYSGLANLQMHWSSFGHNPNPITLDSFRRKERASPEDFDDVSSTEATLAALFASEPPKKPQFEFLDLNELFERPEPEWIVKGVLPEAALGVIYGPHSTGKTFTAVDLALSVALGQPWRGRPAKQGRVLYVAAEDDRGVQIRFNAGLAARGCATAPIRVLPTAPVLIDKAQQEALLGAIKREKRPSIIFFDTLAAVTPGADENSGKEMGELLGYCHTLYKATGALIMLIHHEGKTPGRGSRGWSGLDAGFEVIWKLSADDMTHELEIEKVKNAQKGDLFQFRLIPFGVGKKDTTSCVVEWI